MNLFSDVKAVKSMMLVPLDQHLLETDSMGKVPTHLLIEVGIIKSLLVLAFNNVKPMDWYFVLD